MDYCKYADVFYGNGEINPPPTDGLASKWLYVKAQCGNTVPHCALPFGKMTAGAYSGGYPCGYGNHHPNSCGGIYKLWDKNMAKGFSHIHHSGTGAIQYYYNYAVVTPFYGDISETDKYYELRNETAYPGYYSADFGDVYCELTVNKNVAYHHYFFEKEGGRVAVDFSNDGLNKLFGEKFYSTPKNVHMEINASGEVLVSGIYQGVKLYFCVSLEGVGVKCALFENNRLTDSMRLEPVGEKYGAVFDFDCDSVIVKVSFSTVNYDTAKSFVRSSTDSFDTTMYKAADVWNKYLSAVHIETDDEELKEKFYSNLYHSLIKPVDMTGENILGVRDDVCVDFATFWDMYKTALPLIFTLYPEMGDKIVKSIVNISRTHGKLLCSFGMADVYPCEEQSRMLGIYVLCDAYYRGIPSATARVIDECMHRELERNDFRDFIKKGVCGRYTHILDMADACANVADITNDREFALYLRKLAKNMSNAYGDDGILSTKSQYYEGDRYTYSFRLHNDMDKRIAIAGGKDKYKKLLDDFFGFNGESIVQIRDREGAYEKIENLLQKHHRFEAFNNEPDMETPYGYIFADCHERLCDILYECVYKSFGTGRGGIPGNNDSGGLSSCFVWNVLGIFPVSGQNLVLLGRPFVQRAKLSLSGKKTLEIIKNGEGKYINKITFNGVEINNYTISVKEFMNGGILEFFTI